MAEKKIDDNRLLQLIRDGNTSAEAARKLGVGRAAVCKRLKALNVGVAKDVTLKSAGEIVRKEINAAEQLQKINDYANEILDLLMRWNRGEDEALQILESQVRHVRVNGEEEPVKEFKFKDPRELALKAMCEIRGQLKLQLEIFQTLYDMQAVAAFQLEVLDAIGQASPEIREQIIRNLQERRAIRSTLELEHV